jgi:hypothetical protein
VRAAPWGVKKNENDGKIIGKRQMNQKQTKYKENFDCS